MILALSTMGSTPTAVLLVCAVLACVVAALTSRDPAPAPGWRRVYWLAVALGLYLFILAWNATAAT